MADRSPPDRLNIASFKQRNSAITEDLERQEVERENLWKRLQAARAEGDQLRALAQRSTDEDLSASSAASSPRAIATIDEAPEEEEPVTPPREPTTPLEDVNLSVRVFLSHRHSPAAFRAGADNRRAPHRRLTGATRGADPEHRGGAGYKTRLAGAPAAAASRPGVVALRKRRTRPAPVAARGAAVRDGDRGICMPSVLYAGSDSGSPPESLGGRAPDK
jgi:hypothetical protein